MTNELLIGKRIAYYRKLNTMTQEELSQKLNVSAQAVSKWEQQISSPDIMLLPVIADIFQISIDELFGNKINTEPVFSLVDNVPWNDDKKIRFAVFHGKKLFEYSDAVLSNGLNVLNIHFDYGELYKINGICKLNKE